jgi:hypothetical protein
MLAGAGGSEAKFGDAYLSVRMRNLLIYFLYALFTFVGESKREYDLC